MQTQAYDGYFENGKFFTAGRRTIRLPENKRIIITVLDDPVENMQENEQESRLAWLKRLDEAIKESSDEELVYFPRSQEMRIPHGLTDEV
ncbi:MAG: hypothetical protein LBS21_03625 [Clostridiales bacterium]|nr:hypothetical protein [Clostridiales bacterium]